MDENIVYWQRDPNVFDMRRILVERMRIQPGSLNPRAADAKQTTHRERNAAFPRSLRDDKDSSATVTTRRAALCLQPLAWLLRRSWNGPERRDSKPTANNILDALPLCDISTVAWGPCGDIWCVCVCMQVYTCTFVYVHELLMWQRDGTLTYNFAIRTRQNVFLEPWLMENLHDTVTTQD